VIASIIPGVFHGEARGSTTGATTVRMQPMRSLGPAPSSLFDEHGTPRFGAYSGALPPVDLERLAPSKLALVTQRKRWVYVGLATDEIFFGAAVVHVGYVATAFAFVYERSQNRLIADRSTLAPPLGQQFSDTAGDGCDVRFRALGARFDLKRPHGQDAYDLDLALGDIALHASLDDAPGPPIAVVAKIPGGTVNATEKRALLRSSGELSVGKRRFRLEGGLAGIDYTHGLLARRTAWKWAFLLGQSQSHESVAMNLVEGFVGEPECAVWVGDRLYPVGEGRFTFDPKRPLEPWKVKTACGAVDLVFSPGGMHAEDKNFGIVRSHFVQPAGVYSGTIRLPDRAPLELEGVLGVTEDQDVVW
jgi:hypothetical protein